MEPILNPDSPSDRKKLQKLFRVKTIELQMMRDRGFNINQVYLRQMDGSWNVQDLEWFANPIVDFEQKLNFRQQHNVFQSRQTFSSIYYQPETQKKIMVLYLRNAPGKKVAKEGFQIVKDYIAIQDKSQKIYHFILITKPGLNADASGFLKNQISGYTVETFLDQELAINATQHSLAPIQIQHISRDTNADSDPVAEWAAEEGLQPEKLPIMLNSDPIAKWFGAKPGDIISALILGTEVDTEQFYRMVRQAPAKKK